MGVHQIQNYTVTLNTIPHTSRNTRCHLNIPLSYFVSNTNKPKLHESCSIKSKPYSMLQIKTFLVVLLKKSFVIHLCCQKKYSVREINNFLQPLYMVCGFLYVLNSVCFCGCFVCYLLRHCVVYFGFLWIVVDWCFVFFFYHCMTFSWVIFYLLLVVGKLFQQWFILWASSQTQSWIRLCVSFYENHIGLFAGTVWK